MTDETIRVALQMLGSIGGLSVICIGVLIAALAVLASIASAADDHTTPTRPKLGFAGGEAAPVPATAGARWGR